VKTEEKNQHRVTTIDVLRHGECEDGHCYRGVSDAALSKKGWQQMTSSLGAASPRWQRVVTSPLVRCSAFAQTLAQQYQLPLVTLPALQEINFGEWEGESIDHIWASQQAAVEAWFADPIASPPPAGEAADIFAARVSEGFLSLIREYEGEQLLIVAHGGVMRVLLAHCLSMPLLAMNRFDIPYACLSRIQVIHADDSIHYRLISHNLLAEGDRQR
jgi:alpha-ribazole phosphatase